MWNYVWYTSEKDRDDIESGNTYGADNLLDNVKGLYIRKRSDDLQVSSNPRYQYSQENGFTYNANPYIEIRYAEVLLNYAEAACGLAYAKGGDNALLKEAVDRLKLIRQRVGYTGDCGLQANLESDPAACMSAILYERQIELAFEGDRFWTLARRLLYEKEENRKIYRMNVLADDQGQGFAFEGFYERKLLQTRYWDNKMYLYPIAQTEIDRGRGLVQNPGW